MWRLTVEGQFSAAHQIPNHPGKCSRLHGHNYRVSVAFATAVLDDLGFVLDIAVVRERLVQILESLDHNCLNDLPVFKGKSTSLESVAIYIYKELQIGIDPEERIIELLWVDVAEKSDSAVRYSPPVPASIKK